MFTEIAETACECYFAPSRLTFIPELFPQHQDNLTTEKREPRRVAMKYAQLSGTTSWREPCVAKKEKVMPKQADPTKTIKDFIDFIRDRKPKDAPNCERILRYLVPMLANTVAVVASVPATADELEQLASKILASRLLDCLGENGSSWATWLTEACKELSEIPALRRDYRRAFVRCLEHASASHFVSVAVMGVAPEMQAARNELISVIPHTLASAQALLDTGAKSFYDYSFEDIDAKALRTNFQVIISCFNSMMRHMTRLGIERPQDITSEHIYGHQSSWYKACKAEQVKAIYYQSRWAWRILSQLHPEWMLAEWPQPNEGKSYILQERIPLVESMLREIFKDSHLADATVDDITIDVRRYLGYLSKRGFDLRAFSQSIHSPLDLAALLFAGFPPTKDGRNPDPEKELNLLFADSHYRSGLLGELHASLRMPNSHAPLRPNPLMVRYCDWHLERRTAPSALIFLTRATIIAKRYVRVNGSQFDWYGPIKLKLQRCKDSTPPTPYSDKKETVSTDPNFWLKLVENRRRLSEAGSKLKVAFESEPDPIKRIGLRTRWAVAVRNELMFCFLLAFSLRSQNIRSMIIGKDVLPDQYLVRIPKHRAKNRAPIMRPMYDKGPFRDMKELFDVYFYEARPILLDKREETPYLFVTKGSSEKMVYRNKENGFLQMSPGYVSLVIRRLSIKDFQDLLPGDLNDIAAHLLRHAKTNYLYPIGGETLASQAIGIHVNTVRGYYLGSLKGTDPDVRRIIENLPAGETSMLKLSRKDMRLQLAKNIEKESGMILAPAAITRILAGINL